MIHSSRRIAHVALIAFTASVILSSAGCASMKKPREKWWQFWRPKKAAMSSASVHHPDKMFLPPPSDALGAGGSDPLGNLPQPPTPETDIAMLSEPEPIRELGNPASGLLTVHFAFDSSELDPSAMATLDQNVQWLSSNPGVEIQIEGHCDERGTTEYNLALGERRAKAVKAYLMGRGIPESGIHTISYGEERPLDASQSETAYAMNRRAQFLVY
jgi:peptidoglycan-associated lipoprotein